LTQVVQVVAPSLGERVQLDLAMSKPHPHASSMPGSLPMVPDRFHNMLDLLGQEYVRLHTLHGELMSQNERRSGDTAGEYKESNPWTSAAGAVGDVRPTAKAAHELEEEMAELRPPTESDIGEVNESKGNVMSSPDGISGVLEGEEISRRGFSSVFGSGQQSASVDSAKESTASELEGDNFMERLSSLEHRKRGGRCFDGDSISHPSHRNGVATDTTSPSHRIGVATDTTYDEFSRRGSISGEQQSMRMLGAWAEGGQSTAHAAFARRGRSTITLHQSSTKNPGRTMASSGIMRAGDAMRGSSFLQYFMVAPTSFQRISWDVLSTAVMAYDAVTIPLQVFDLQMEDFLEVMAFFTTVFWTTDMFMSFLSGYHIDGLVEMRPSHVACNYLRSWFPLDFFILFFDWLTVISDGGAFDSAGVLRITKSLRAARVLRVIRLLRLVKVSSGMDALGDLFSSSEAAQMIFTILRFLASLLMVNHFVACVWYGIGELGVPESSDTWIQRFEGDFGNDASFRFRYLTSVHWSLTQFTPASMEVTPRNWLERGYAIIVLVFALATFSTLLSTITNSMLHLRKASYEMTRQQDFVRRYIADKRISLDLGNRIIGFLRQRRYNASSSKRKLHEDDIDAFKILPDSLKEDLHGEIFLPVVVAHPFFHHVHGMDPFTAVRVCHKAIQERPMAMKSELFLYGQKATHMYFLTSGSVNYLFGIDEQASMHRAGTWFAEMCLWFQWDHRGRVAANTPCEILALKSHDFTHIVASKPLAQLCRVYAGLYRDKLEAACLPRVVPDTWGDFDLLQELAHMAVDQYHQELLPATGSKGEDGGDGIDDKGEAGVVRGMLSSLRDLRMGSGGGSAQKLKSFLRQPMGLFSWGKSGGSS